MADVRPFRGLRYNLEKDLSSVITPPYDVINIEQQQGYYQKSPYNIIRLEFGLEFPNDSPRFNKYTRAANTLSRWIEQHILVREEHPAFYLIEHRFPYLDGYRSFWGLIGAVRLEEFGTGHIRPAEETMGTPIVDRLSLFKACRANISPLIGVFDQRKKELPLILDFDYTRPSVMATDDSGVTFNLWVLTEERTIRRISSFFSEQAICIADGHHRYSTALIYRNEVAASEDDPSNFVMMTLISPDDDELTLLPVHRLVRNVDTALVSKLRDELARHFRIKEFSPYSVDASENLKEWLKALGKVRGTAFGLYGVSERSFWLLTPYNISDLQGMMPQDRPAAWRNLDVSLLHWMILKGILGIGSNEDEEKCLEYTSDGREALEKVDTGKAQLAFFLNPVPISDFLAVADSGSGMPPKSTYFYPKTPAGLVINPLF